MEELRKKLMEELKNKLGEGYEVSPVDVNKNNGTILHGISIMLKGNIGGPTVYVDNFYQRFQGSNEEIEEMIDYILEDIRACYEIDDEELQRNVYEYDRAKEHLRVVLCNYEANKETLSSRPHLFYDKTGIRPAFQENEDNWVAKEVGHRLEDLVAEIFSQKTGLKIFPVRTMFRHPLYRFMLADVDFFIEFADGTYGILECKTTNYNCQEKWANNTIPVNYEYQVRHYMSVMNIDKAYIACLYGNNAEEFFIRPLERDLETEEDLIAEEKYFWEEKVLKKVEPDYVEKADLVIASIKKHYGPADPQAAGVILSTKNLSGIKTYLSLKQEKAKLEGEVKRLEERMKQSYLGVLEELGASCSGTIMDGTTKYEVSYNPTYRTSIDKKGLEKLKIQHPDVYDDYVQTTENRRFVVKERKVA